MDMENIQELLSEAEKQLELQRKHQQETGEAFNIFTVLDRERKEESTHCRLHYELLNPDGRHGCGDAFLKRFFKTVLKKLYQDGTGVYREKRIENGRIDLVIEGQNYFYPIEVKLDAGDQYRQIERYAKFSERQRKGRSVFDTAVYYLTLDGHRPSKASKGEIQEDQIKCISFPKQIRAWLTQCVEIVKDKPNIKVILDQYIQLIDRLEGTIMADSLAKMINCSPNSYKSAMEIAKKLPYVQAEKMLAVFRKIEEFVGDQFGEIIVECSSPDTLNYYTAAKRPDPSLAYRIKSEGEKSVELWFQVDHYNDTLWYGIVLHKGKNIPNTEEDIRAFQGMFDNDKWKRTLNDLLKRKDKWWVWSQGLPQSNPLNFRADNERYSDLFDKDKFDKIIKEIEEEICSQLKTIKNTGCQEDSA